MVSEPEAEVLEYLHVRVSSISGTVVDPGIEYAKHWHSSNCCRLLVDGGEGNTTPSTVNGVQKSLIWQSKSEKHPLKKIKKRV